MINAKYGQEIGDFWLAGNYGVFLPYLLRKKVIVVHSLCKLLQKQAENWKAEWPWEVIWKTKALPKRLVFGWVATKNACLTLDTLQRSGISSCSKCFVCEIAWETTDSSTAF